MLTSLCFVMLFRSPGISPESDLKAITNGVEKVAKPGVPGVVSVIGENSVSFLVGVDGKSLVPVASAGRLGRGKVAAFGHGGYFSAGAIHEGDTGRMMANLIRWSSSRLENIRVGSIRNEYSGWIKELGFSPVELRRASLRQDLQAVDVAIIPAGNEESELDAWVRSGGSLITAHTPWGWMQLNPGKDLATEMPLQNLLHAAGLSFSDGSADRVWPAKDLEESNRTSAAAALHRLDTDAAQSTSVLLAALRSTPKGDPFNQALRRLTNSPTAIAPTKERPLLAKDGRSRLSLAVRFFDLGGQTKPGVVEPSASDFPGSVPASAKRESLTISVPLDRRQWVSTGAYAAPGEEVSLQLPAGLKPQGLSIQIGCHTDQLWSLDKWERHPQITVRTSLRGDTTRLTSPFGGLIYVVVDRPQAAPPIRVNLSGVVRSARFNLGTTTNAEWRRQLNYSAPWAEIGSERLIFSVPLEDARKVENPEALMKLWDKIIGLYGELDGNPLFDRPERIVCDRQISAGYMHSGYPIMTWMDKSVPLSLNAQELTTGGTWGHWHELGHNRQKPEWTFEGTGEVTNNLFTLYMMDRIAGKKIWDRIGSERAKVQAYIAKGGDFAQWKREPFLALYMYGLLIQEFGWDSLKSYFRSYSTGVRPTTDQEKRDQFMIRYSRVVGRNLGNYFQAWGIPTTAPARDSLRDLPVWMPKEW